MEPTDNKGDETAIAAAPATKMPPAVAGPTKPPPPPVAAAAGAPPTTAPPPTRPSQQRQLAEFNQWLYRWNNYQQHLAQYWQGRYSALHRETASGGGKVASGGKKGRFKSKDKNGKGSEGGGKVEGKWNLRYQELVDFKEEHGHTNVPKEFTYKYSPPLGHWVGRMRHMHKKEALSAERVERLYQIGFEFVLAKSDKINFSVVWDKSFQALKSFKDMNGHVEVPNGYRPQPDMAWLDGWITRQRKLFKDSKLPDHMVVKLQGLGLNLGGRGRPFGLESEELWTTNYKAMASYCNENGDCDVHDEDRELGAWVKAQRDTYSEGMLPDDRVKLLNKIGFNFYHGRKSERTGTSDPWRRRLSELQAYKDKTGNTNVPKKFTLNLGLGDFVYNQRMAYKDENLTVEKIKSLEEMGFDWTLKQRKARKKAKTNWEKRFEELLEFKSKHGTLHVPVGHADNPTLGSWAKRQRKYHREGVMKDDKHKRMIDMGFDFGGPKQEKKPWMEQYESLVEFRNEHGHNDVPVHYKTNAPLYYWIGTQKQTYKKGKLSEEKIAMLQEIDFNFAAKSRDRTPKSGTRGGKKPFLDPEEWERLIGQLEEYRKEHGDIDVPQRAGRLGSFVHYMRFYVKGGKLTQQHIDRLNGIGFSWNVTDDRWNARYQALVKFKTENGNFDIPSGHSLYSWVSYQRKLSQEHSLPQDRVEILSNIDFDFNIPLPKRFSMGKETPDQWEGRFKNLVAFKEEHGHCGVPATYMRCPALYKWASAQQKKYQSGSLSDDQIDRLHEIDFNFTRDTLPQLGLLKVPQLEPVDRQTYLEGLWDKSYQELAAYKNHFGHCNIPISYEANPSLGAWAFSQRMAYKKDKLSQDRVDKLNELAFSFGPQKRVVEEV